LLHLIKLLLKTLGALMLLVIHRLKIAARSAAPFRKRERPRCEVNEETCDKKANGQSEEKRQNSL